MVFICGYEYCSAIISIYCRTFFKYIDYSNIISNNANIGKYKLGCTIGAHVGPGTVGIAFFSKR